MCHGSMALSSLTSVASSSSPGRGVSDHELCTYYGYAFIGVVVDTCKSVGIPSRCHIIDAPVGVASGTTVSLFRKGGSNSLGDVLDHVKVVVIRE